jgi:hypothetical protein
MGLKSTLSRDGTTQLVGCNIPVTLAPGTAPSAPGIVPIAGYFPEINTRSATPVSGFMRRQSVTIP